MNPLFDLRVSRRICLSPSPVDLSSPSFSTRRPIWPLAAALLALPLAAAGVAAQQPYGYAQQQYPSQYAAPAQQYGYPQQQPQYAQPQYQQPQYGQPQYQQPQYQQPQQYNQPQYNAQPQYNTQPQYAQPEENQPQGYSDPEYAQPQYAQPQYPQQQADAGLPNPGDDLDAQQPAPTQQPLSAGDLEQLVAPIAIYPDNLVAQILAGATYPAQVSAADQWVKGMTAQGYGSPDQIAAGANTESGWDPSVKALTAFPQVLDMLNQNLQWTTALGNAYYNQPQDVMQTIQVLRQRAEQAGNLETTPQEQVNDDQGYIDVAPTNPEVEYVPAYDPWAVYGAPIVAYPGYSPFGGYFGLGIHFGLGCALNAFAPFGWMGWGLNWFGHALLFNHGAYYSHSNSVRDWGFAHGGPRAYPGHGGFGGHSLPESGRGGGFNGHPMPEGGRGNGFGNRAQQPYNRPGNGFPGNGFNSARGNGQGNNFARPAYNNGGQGYARGNAYAHPEMPGQMAYNRSSQQMAGRQAYGGVQAYAHPGYGSYGYQGRSAQSYGGPSYGGQNYGARAGAGYAGAYRTPAYRAPQQNYGRAYAGGNTGYGGQSFARNESSGGFRGFSGGREPRGFSGGGFSGGRAPKAYSGGGGGHFSGGGHASGGGHSGGGHSGGGHSGGGGHGRR
jgi:hypothetical protein